MIEVTTVGAFLILCCLPDVPEANSSPYTDVLAFPEAQSSFRFMQNAVVELLLLTVVLSSLFGN